MIEVGKSSEMVPVYFNKGRCFDKMDLLHDQPSRSTWLRSRQQCEMAGRVLKALEEQGLLRASGKTVVVYGARPKAKTAPVAAARIAKGR